ncbi:azurin [Lysobacter sp. A03]|uniref:azurin n=1 Tax=Lysobacter sp. A03 TaxID=1199154 RepID=UPI0005B743A7|nr:azurin [Lysobacter sp. A03]KIQ97015.1 Azurin [Lysobacter sp. A03]
MNVKITVLTAACALALAACGDKSPPPAPAAPATTAPATTAPAETAPAETTPAASTTASAPVGAGGAAVVNDCATEIEGNDAMQFNVKSITVPASCSEFKITLKHTGKMPVAAMGHNVVITTLDDMKKVAADGMGAGIDNDYVKPGDDRVIAHTKMIGGGETTSVSFDVSKIKGDGPYEFFCSFPGHSAIMKGTIAVE